MPNRELVCSFCSKGATDVRKLIAGPTVYICDECIDRCNDLVSAEHGRSTDARAPAAAPPAAARANSALPITLSAASPGEVIRPPRLREGDRIAVVAPAGAFDPAALKRGIERLRARGFDVVHRADITERVRYLAGSDERRARELEEAFADASIRALFCARGGYGSSRALERMATLSVGSIAAPKIVVGYSDATVLLNAITGGAGVVSFHGPQVAVDLAQDGFEASLDDLLDTLMGRRFPGPFQAKPLAALVTGDAEGRLMGGCLSMLVTMIGTPWEPNLRGSILLLEDIAEPAFRIDRMLTHLRQAGALDGVTGVVIGHLKDVRAPEGTTIVDVFRDCLSPLAIPVAMGLETGHGVPCRTLPLGARARLDTTSGQLDILESVVA